MSWRARTLGAVLFLLARPTLAEAVTGGHQVQIAQASQQVLFNTRTHKVHCPSCRAVGRCTHCVPMTQAEAAKRGGVPCHVCGGS